MGRIVRITIDSPLTVATSGSLHPLLYGAPAGQLVRVIEAGWAAVTSEDTQQLETLLARFTGTPTGSTANLEVHKADPGDAAHGGTITHTITAGLTIVADSIIHSDAGPIMGGYIYRPTPEQLKLIPAAAQVGLFLNEMPQASFTMRPWMELELIGA